MPRGRRPGQGRSRVGERRLRGVAQGWGGVDWVAGREGEVMGLLGLFYLVWFEGKEGRRGGEGGIVYKFVWCETCFFFVRKEERCF